MSTTKEILEREASGEVSIYLHREGLFWKAYQRSAFLIHKIDPNFKVRKQFVKAVNAEIVSLGFPENTVKRLFRSQDIEMLNEKLVRIKSTAVLDDAEYKAWFATIALERSTYNRAALPTAAAIAPAPTAPTPAAPSLSDREASVLKQLREFRMETATPIDCLTFLVTLRKELKQYGPL